MPAQIHTSLLLISISLCNIFFGKLVSTYHRASADKCQRLFTIFRASSFRRQVFFSFCLHLIPDRRMIHPCSSTSQTTSRVSCFFAALRNTFRSVGVAKFGGGAIRQKKPRTELVQSVSKQHTFLHIDLHRYSLGRFAAHNYTHAEGGRGGCTNTLIDACVMPSAARQKRSSTARFHQLLPPLSSAFA